jgi:hypothetical protein
VARSGFEVLRVAIEQRHDQAWLWANVCSGLKRASVAPPDVIHSLENATAREFPLALVDAARHLTQPVVIVVDNASQITSGEVRRGLDVLTRHSPPSLRVLLAS